MTFTSLIMCPVISIRWRETAGGHWTGVMRGKVWTLTQTENTLWYYVYGHQMNPGAEDAQKCKVKEERRSGGMMDLKQEEEKMCTVVSDLDHKDEERLRDYFQLNVKLEDLYRHWSAVDPHFKQIANVFTGTCSVQFNFNYNIVLLQFALHQSSCTRRPRKITKFI